MSGRSTRRRGNKFEPNADELKVIDLIVAGIPAAKAFADCNVTYIQGSRDPRYRNTKYRAGLISCKCVGNLQCTTLKSRAHIHQQQELYVRGKKGKKKDGKENGIR